jgi:hypothetical protein
MSAVGADCQILAEQSAGRALSVLERLRDDREKVAVVIADLDAEDVRLGLPRAVPRNTPARPTRPAFGVRIAETRGLAAHAANLVG